MMMTKNLISRIYEKIRTPVLILAAAATLNVMPYISGCASQQSQRTYTQSELELIRENNARVMAEAEGKAELIRINNARVMAEAEKKQLQQPQTNYPTKSKEDIEFEKVKNIYKSLFFGLGSNITSYEYMKRNP